MILFFRNHPPIEVSQEAYDKNILPAIRGGEKVVIILNKPFRVNYLENAATDIAEAEFIYGQMVGKVKCWANNWHQKGKKCVCEVRVKESEYQSILESYDFYQKHKRKLLSNQKNMCAYDCGTVAEEGFNHCYKHRGIHE